MRLPVVVTYESSLCWLWQWHAVCRPVALTYHASRHNDSVNCRHNVNRVEKEALTNELKDLREMMAAEANSRAALQDSLAAAERQLGEARNELDMTKSVSKRADCSRCCCTHSAG